MKINIKQKKKYISLSLIAALGVGASFLFWQNVRAVDDITTGLAQENAAAQKEKEEKIEELEKRADVYREIIDIKKKQGETLNNQLEITDTSIQQVQAQIEVSKQQIDDYNSQITRIESQIKEKEETILSQRELLVSLMQKYYEVNLASPIISYLTSGNIASFIVEKDRLSQTGDKIKELVVSVKEIRDDLEVQSKELDKKKGEFVVTKEKLQNQGSTLESAKKQKETLLAQTKGEENRYKSLLEQVQEQIQQEIEQIELQKEGIDLGPLPPSKSGLFSYPVNPVKITQGYGKTSFSNNYASGKHNGVDFSINYGKIFAAGNGTVLATGNNGKYAYGKWVAIDHGDGLLTLYGHFSNIAVSKGGKIKQGDVIGISGNTGFSTGPHLHFSVFAKKTFELVESTKVSGLMLPTGASVNPMNYL
ncbi:MAG: peptidoglycan DD-metalloendopeptidase family protein [Candidatus Moranbacteria bacterium]|nr:peptidoglycan DD-metalloendopeptidase family protein [Candidatus Moranbacteria bacterium]